MSMDPDAPPFNPLPPVVVALAGVMFLIELALLAGANGFVGGPDAVGWRLELLERYAFSGPLLEAMAARGEWPLDQVLRLVTYPFVNFSFTGMIFGVVILLAMGKMVGEAFGPWPLLAIFFGSSVLGAIAFTILTNDARPLAGAFPGVYGLIGGYTFMIWVYLGAVGQQQVQAFSLIAILMGIQLVFSLFSPGVNDWVADIAGFATGFVLSFVVSPGGFRRVLDKFRQR